MLIFPQWSPTHFWPMLFPDGVNPDTCVVELVELVVWDKLVLPGRRGANLFRGISNTGVMAAKLLCFHVIIL